jgi:O-antigen ligase
LGKIIHYISFNYAEARKSLELINNNTFKKIKNRVNIIIMNKVIKNIIITLLFATPAVLLVVPSDMFFPFISGKNLLFRFLVEIICGLYLFLILVDANYRTKKSMVLIGLSLFTAVILIADIFSPNFAKAFWSNFERSEGFITIIHLFFYVIILGAVLDTKELWNKFFASSLAVSIAMNLFGWLQYIGGIKMSQGLVRVDSVMGNAAYFAGFLMFQVFILLFLFKRKGLNLKYLSWILFVGSLLFAAVYIMGNEVSMKGRWMVFLSVLVGSACLWVSYITKKINAKLLPSVLFCIILFSHVALIYFTQTRGAMLGLIGGVFLSALIIAIKEKNDRSMRNSAISIIIATIVLIAGFISIRETDFVKNNATLKRFADISWSETKTQARQIVWPIAIEGVKERPLLGWGQEGFNYIFAKHYNPEMWKYESWFDRAHNVFIDWLVAGGILGLLSYVSLYVIAVIIILRRIFKESATEGALLIGLVAGYAFQNIFIFDNLGSYILFFSFLGFLHFEDQNRSTLPVTAKPKQNDSEDINPLFVGITIGCVTAIFIYFLVLNSYVQNKTLIQALSSQKQGPMENLRLFKKAISYGGVGATEARAQLHNISQKVVTTKEVDMKIKVAFFEESKVQAQAQLTESPLEPKDLFIPAAFFAQVGQFDLAFKYFDEALKLAPKKVQIINQLGIAYLSKGDIQNATKYFKQSYDLAPEYPEAGMLYVSVLLEQDKEQAFSILNKFAQKGVPPMPFMIEILKQKNLKNELVDMIKVAYGVEPSAENKQLLESLTK